MMKLLVVHEWTDVLVRASRKQWPLTTTAYASRFCQGTFIEIIIYAILMLKL